MRRVTILIWTLIAALGCDSEDSLDPNFENYWIKYYGEDGSQFGVDIAETPDGGYYILGNSVDNFSSAKMILVRTDELGNQIDEIIYLGGDTDVEATNMEVDVDGSLIISGNIVNSRGNTDIILYRLTTDGVKLDSTILGNSSFDDVINDFTITNDGQIITMGSTDSLNKILTYKLNSDFSLGNRWSTAIGFDNQNNQGINVSQEENGNITFFASTDAPDERNANRDGFNFYVNKLTINGGNVSFPEKFYGTASNQFLNSTASTLDGGAILVGTTLDGNTEKLYLARTISSGFNLAFENQLPTIENISGVDVIQSSFGGMLILGVSNDGTGNNIYLARLTDNGDLIWSTTFGGLDNDGASRLIESGDGSILITGSVELESQSKMAFIRVNRNGEFQ